VTSLVWCLSCVCMDVYVCGVVWCGVVWSCNGVSYEPWTHLFPSLCVCVWFAETLHTKGARASVRSRAPPLFTWT
jgi:hypothetical protein